MDWIYVPSDVAGAFLEDLVLNVHEVSEIIDFVTTLPGEFVREALVKLLQFVREDDFHWRPATAGASPDRPDSHDSERLRHICGLLSGLAD